MHIHSHLARVALLAPVSLCSGLAAVQVAEGGPMTRGLVHPAPWSAPSPAAYGQPLAINPGVYPRLGFPQAYPPAAFFRPAYPFPGPPVWMPHDRGAAISRVGSNHRRASRMPGVRGVEGPVGYRMAGTSSGMAGQSGYPVANMPPMQGRFEITPSGDLYLYPQSEIVGPRGMVGVRGMQGTQGMPGM